MKPVYYILACLLFSGSASALDCWIPTVDNTQPRYRKEALPHIRSFVSTVEQVVRDNPHFKAMPRPIRIRAAYSVGPGDAQVNVYAYQPPVWTPGQCNVVPGADRCCHDGSITVLVNGAATTGPEYVIRCNKVNWFKEPKRTGTTAGFPEYEGRVYMSADGRLPWIPFSVEEYLADQERQVLERREEFRTTLATTPGMDQKTIDTIEGNIARDLDKIVSYRASLTPAQLAAQAYQGNGPLNLGRADDARSVKLVKPDRDYFDLSQTDRIRLITVYVGVAPNDPVPERLATMQRTKETFDFQRLAKFLN